MRKQPEFSGFDANDPTILEWVPENRITELNPPSALLPLLQEHGLLTARVQQRCEQSFRLQLLQVHDEGAGWLSHYEPWAGGEGDRREIVMWCDDIPGLYAETVIPDETAKAQPWIRTLGTQPLGERLQFTEGVTRSDFTYAYIPVTSATLRPTLPDAWLKQNQRGVYARRSTFRIHDHYLWLVEVFLGALMPDPDE